MWFIRLRGRITGWRALTFEQMTKLCILPIVKNCFKSNLPICITPNCQTKLHGQISTLFSSQHFDFTFFLVFRFMRVPRYKKGGTLISSWWQLSFTSINIMKVEKVKLRNTISVDLFFSFYCTMVCYLNMIASS